MENIIDEVMSIDRSNFRRTISQQIRKIQSYKAGKKTYDCFNALCRGEKVVCRRGYAMSLSWH